MTHTELVSRQRDYFRTGVTLPYRFRREMLDRLYDAILEWEEPLEETLRSDLAKSPFEAYATEVGFALSEIDFIRKHLHRWMRPRRVRTELANFPGTSRIYAEPYGNVLIMSPWNYPLLLTISPLAGALAAGNTAVLKPSNYSVHTSEAMKRLIESIYPPEYVTVVEGDRYVNQDLLDAPFDYIFFTGSKGVGRVVMEKAAAHLTPMSLELGGKSPCIIDRTAKIDLAARRIAWGKCLNSGQTCVAPDYALVHRSVVEPFVAALEQAFVDLYGDHPESRPDYPRIINRRKYDRLKGLLEQSKVIYGGVCDDATLRIAPTLIRATWESPTMADEIFGPLLPILVYDHLDEVILEVSGRPRPLALYLFTEDRAVRDHVVAQISYGGGCINDTIMHLVSSHLPFGGVGESGMGGYHGRHSFDTFTHEKSVLDKSTRLDVPIRYGLKRARDLRLLKKILR